MAKPQSLPVTPNMDGVPNPSHEGPDTDVVLDEVTKKPSQTGMREAEEQTNISKQGLVKRLRKPPNRSPPDELAMQMQKLAASKIERQTRLPQELLDKMFSYVEMTPQDYIALSQVCRYFRLLFWPTRFQLLQRLLQAETMPKYWPRSKLVDPKIWMTQKESSEINKKPSGRYTCSSCLRLRSIRCFDKRSLCSEESCKPVYGGPKWKEPSTWLVAQDFDISQIFQTHWLNYLDNQTIQKCRPDSLFPISEVRRWKRTCLDCYMKNGAIPPGIRTDIGNLDGYKLRHASRSAKWSSNQRVFFKAYGRVRTNFYPKNDLPCWSRDDTKNIPEDFETCLKKWTQVSNRILARGRRWRWKSVQELPVVSLKCLRCHRWRSNIHYALGPDAYGPFIGTQREEWESDTEVMMCNECLGSSRPCGKEKLKSRLLHFITKIWQDKRDRIQSNCVYLREFLQRAGPGLEVIEPQRHKDDCDNLVKTFDRITQCFMPGWKMPWPAASSLFYEFQEIYKIFLVAEGRMKQELADFEQFNPSTSDVIKRRVYQAVDGGDWMGLFQWQGAEKYCVKVYWL